MKTFLFISLFLMLAASANAQTPEPSPTPENKPAVADPQATPTPIRDPYIPHYMYTRPDKNTRLKRYVKSVVGPVAIGKSVISSGYSTWRNSPEEWGDNWEGFGRRFASSMGKSAIKNTTSYALDEAFKLDSSFYRSNKKNFGGRLGDALLSTFTARKPDGKKVFGFPRIAGTYTASIIAAEAWYPKRFDYKDGLRSGTISLGLNAAFNVIKEFIKIKK